MRALKILFEDEDLLLTDKPAGFHSHPPEDPAIRISLRWCALTILEKQRGQKLYPVHRLDRATSGLWLLAKNSAAAADLQRQFRDRSIHKIYYCVLRGSLQGTATINNPLRNEDGREQEALTRAEEIFRFPLPIPGPGADHRWFTLSRVEPVTGRYHQIRRHLAGLSLPLVGDQRHGDKKLNRLFREHTGKDGLLLRCVEMRFHHPRGGEPLRFRARWPGAWHAIFDRSGFCPLA